jgi:hypothetical protein
MEEFPKRKAIINHFEKLPVKMYCSFFQILFPPVKEYNQER